MEKVKKKYEKLIQKKNINKPFLEYKIRQQNKIKLIK